VTIPQGNAWEVLHGYAGRFPTDPFDPSFQSFASDETTL